MARLIYRDSSNLATSSASKNDTTLTHTTSQQHH